MALDVILYNRHNTTSKEFIGHLSSEAKEKIQSTYSLEKLILEHTMFSQYARFLSSERKKSAIHHLAHTIFSQITLFGGISPGLWGPEGEAQSPGPIQGQDGQVWAAEDVKKQQD